MNCDKPLPLSLQAPGLERSFPCKTRLTCGHCERHGRAWGNEWNLFFCMTLWAQVNTMCIDLCWCPSNQYMAMFIIEKGANHRSLSHAKVSKRLLQLLINQHFLFFPTLVVPGRWLLASICVACWVGSIRMPLLSVQHWLEKMMNSKLSGGTIFDFNACIDRLTGPCTTYAVYCWARWKYDSKVILRNAQNTFYVWFCTDRNLQESVFSRKHLKKVSSAA